MANQRMSQPASAATLPVIRALLDDAARRNYHGGVLGIRARPEWTGAREFSHGDVAVRVMPCESVLAVWEAISGRDRKEWLVVLTDRDDRDLGASIRAHLVGHRLRTPDPWQSVQDAFGASGLDSALTSSEGSRQIADGLLAAAPAGGWRPALGGVLTRDHAFAAVASAHLGFADSVVDLTSVLNWTADPRLTGLVADLREIAGHSLTDAVLAWAATRCGLAGGPVLHLLRAGQGGDCVSLGLVAGLLSAATSSINGDVARIGREGLIRIEPLLGGSRPAGAALASWAAESMTLITELRADPSTRSRGDSLLARADELLRSARAEGIAEDSDLLRAGLGRRFAALATVLREALPAPGIELRGSGSGADPDRRWLDAERLAPIEETWRRVASHQLADPREPRTRAFHGAVRLARWLAEETAPALGGSGADAELASLMARHMKSDAWADSAINDAAPGVGDAELGAGLAAALTAATVRRSAHDVIFARALARQAAEYSASLDSGSGPVLMLEHVLPAKIIPLAQTAPVLLLVLDGMSAGVATEVIGSVLERTADGWAEALLPGTTTRASALAVLPTLTEVSRTSLLSGRLTTGGQDAEQKGFEKLYADGKLPGKPVLFHKKPLDSSQPGHALASDVAAAIDNTDGMKLVACVLNTIDDALDRSDPGGIDWADDTIRHLQPLLERARLAGRVVVLTADHGHIVERRRGTQRSAREMTSGRSRSASEPAGDGEVMVTGDRVLMPPGKAVLAVNERLRYGPLKAGYHGGASPAEAVVTVAVLVPGGVPENTDLQLAPPQQPSWWLDPVALPGGALPAQPGRAGAGAAPLVKPARHGGVDPRLRSTSPSDLTLFDVAEETPEPAAATAPPSQHIPADRTQQVASEVIGSAAYAAQRKIAGRLSVADDQVAGLLAALLAAPGTRLAPVQAASVLAVAPVMLRGAILHVQRLLNVEGYPVLRIDEDGVTVILDEPLLREQFGVMP